MAKVFKNSAKVFLVFSLIWVVALFFTPPKVLALSWAKVTIDSEWAYYPAIASDSSGNYVIAFYKQDGCDCLSYARSTDGGTSWDIDEINSTPYPWASISIDVDINDNFIVANYQDGTDLNFAKSTDGGVTWSTSTIDTTAVEDNVSLVSDNFGNYLVGWMRLTDSLWYKTSTDGGSTWSSFQKLFDSGSRRHVSHAVDSSNNYLAASYAASAAVKDLVFSKSTDRGGSWNHTTVDSPDDVGMYPSITVDSSDNYLISYYNNTSDDLKFAKSTDGGSSWSTITIDSTDDVGFYSSIEADSSGNYLVVYEDLTNNDLKFALSNDGGSTWNIEVVDTNIASYPPTLTVDSYGNYLMAYTFDPWELGGDEGLKFAKADVTAPAISLTVLSPDPTSDNTPFFTGTATEETGTTSNVQYQIDSTSGTWTNCTADDGSFDEASETFTCNVASALSDGSHTIYVRATDSNSNTTTTANLSSDSFVVDAANPAVFDLITPLGNTTKTSFHHSFRKSSDVTTSISSYSVNIDEGKNRNFSTSGIPSSGNGSASYVWKDDNDVKIEFFNENDSDSTNDEIKVTFKDLSNNPLTEGRHFWKTTANDGSGNSTSVSTNFDIDLTQPSFSSLTIADVSGVSGGDTYIISNKTPSFQGRVSDSYQGSTRTNSDGTKDTFEKVSSGPDSLALSFYQLQADGNYVLYSTLSHPFSSIVDVSNPEKYSDFYVTTPYPLTDGFYRIIISTKDQAGNEKEFDSFYLSLNYTGEAVASTVTPPPEITAPPAPERGGAVAEEKEEKKPGIETLKEIGALGPMKVLHQAIKTAAPITPTAIVTTIATFNFLALFLQIKAKITPKLIKRIFQALGIIPGGKPKGVVFDSQSYNGIPFAILVFQRRGKKGKSEEMVVTSEKGIYQEISLIPGKYLLEVKHQDYNFPTRAERPAYLSFKDFYKGESFILKAKTKEFFLVPGDPLTLEDRLSLFKRTKFLFASFKRLINKISFPLYFLSVYSTYLYPSYWNLTLVVFGFTFIVVKYRSIFFRPNIQGKVTDEKGNPIANVIVRLRTYPGDDLTDITLTNPKGCFFFKQKKQVFQYSATKPGYTFLPPGVPTALPTLDTSKGKQKLEIVIKRI